MESKQKLYNTNELHNTNEYIMLKEDVYFGNEYDIAKELISKSNELQTVIEFNCEPVEYCENTTTQKQKKRKRDYTKLIRKMGYLVASSIAVVTLAHSTSLNRTPQIPDDAIVFDGHYYKLYDEQFTWEEAQAFCKELGGYLVIISYEEEQWFIERINSHPRWIGSDVPYETNEKGNFKTRGDGVNGYICEWD